MYVIIALSSKPTVKHLFCILSNDFLKSQNERKISLIPGHALAQIPPSVCTASKVNAGKMARTARRMNCGARQGVSSSNHFQLQRFCTPGRKGRGRFRKTFGRFPRRPGYNCRAQLPRAQKARAAKPAARKKEELGSRGEPQNSRRVNSP